MLLFSHLVVFPNKIHMKQRHFIEKKRVYKSIIHKYILRKTYIQFV